MVRYPREERSSTENLRNMRIRTPDGHEVAFEQVAEVTTGMALASIRRENRERTVSVNANVDPAITQSAEVIRDVQTNFVSQLLRKYPNVNFKLGESSMRQAELARRIGQFFLVALFLIYALLAIPLRSYAQPLMVMAVIPFGFIGAMVGHILFGITISFISIFGLIALSGVIVNDSLILVDFVNRGRREGRDLHDAVVNAGTRRFRAILLTTMTTFFGLLPMMFETSMQAQMLIPMAISLAFGIVFGTVLTLFMVPCLYLVLEDLKDWALNRKDSQAVDQPH
jgi:multidrug efflux pump subunit AcrB